MTGSRSRHGTQRGALLALGTVAVSGLAVYYLNAFGVKLVPDATEYSTADIGVAAIILVAVATGVLTAVSKGAAPDPRVVVGYLLVIAGAALVALVSDHPPSGLRATSATADA